MAKRKICVVVASRANYGRIKSALLAIEKHAKLELQLIVEASALLYNYGNAVQVMKNDGLKVTATSYNIVAGENLVTMAKSTGLALMELSSLFDHLQPDIVLTVADRFETLATAVAASYLNITLAHTQGGELTGSIDESVRHAITKLSHIHFPANEEAVKVLRQLGENPDCIFKTGCPAIDVVVEALTTEPDNLFEKYGGTGDPLDWNQPYLVMLQHPNTQEYDQSQGLIGKTLDAVCKTGMQTVVLWPNADAGSAVFSKDMRMFKARAGDTPLHFYRNFPPEDYVHLINCCACLVGNSSSGIRESAFLGTPAVNIGTRQSNRQRGPNVIDVDYDTDAIHNAIMKQLNHDKYESSPIYGTGDAGEKIADILSTCELSVAKKFFHV